MNAQSNAMSESPSGPQETTPTKETRPMYWSIRRELWENRSIYIAPLIIAGVVLVGFLIAPKVSFLRWPDSLAVILLADLLLIAGIVLRVWSIEAYAWPSSTRWYGRIRPGTPISMGCSSVSTGSG